MKVLVTGGAGYISSHLVKALRQAGDAVRVLDINPISDEHLIDTGCDFLQGSVADSSLVTQAVGDVEVVYHLAWGFYAGDERREIHMRLTGLNIILTYECKTNLTTNRCSGIMSA